MFKGNKKLRYQSLNVRRKYIMKEKVILAYSGGLDTTAIIPWLKETYDYDVVCCCIDCGQGNELDGLEERAALSGASKLYIENIIDEFCDDYIMPCVKAGAVYEHQYLLGTSMARPVIAKKLVEIARKEGATAICHGATGKGNDQIRFELGIKALAPDLKIIAPWRMPELWKMNSREEEMEYCEAHGIHLPFKADSSYSRDRNLWHISHEGLELEDPANEPNYEHMLVLGVTPQKAPDKETEISIKFEEGIPVELNGKKMKVSEIITELNKLGGENGIGIVDIVENRVVGMKSRGVYETPGGTILMAAHDQIEELILDRETMEMKKKLGSQFAQIVYEGKWFTPLREAIQAFVDSTQKYVTGEVKMKLYKGNIIKAGTTSPYSLYNESLASFTTGDLYDHQDASGFITLFGLPLKVRAMKMQEVENNK
jgi:argininosuccinate synthase